MSTKKAVTRTVTVNVTATDIQLGKPMNCQHCPVAMAMKRALRRSVAVNTSVGGWWYFDGRYAPEVYIPLPLPAVKAARKFDQGKEIKPFSFDVQVPQ